jgi:adenosylcobinamide-phosphate synthase
VVLAATAARRLPWPAQGVALWTLLSGRLLLDEATAVEATLRDEGLGAARERLSWLVSRDTAALTAPQVRAATVQTLAENTTDSVTATLWWWSVAGLPGAALHRWADTLDSRWGYVEDTWLARGRAAARLDDVLAWLPARLTALLWHGALDRQLRDQACRTPSPNGGWTMGAAALSTDSSLEKPGAYVLHPAGREPDAATVTTALRDARRVMGTALVAALVLATARDADDVGAVHR